MGVLNNIQKNANKAIRPLCERLGYNKPIYSPSIPHLFPLSIHGEGGPIGRGEVKRGGAFNKDNNKRIFAANALKSRVGKAPHRALYAIGVLRYNCMSSKVMNMSEETRGTSELSLKRAIGQLLIVGFEGTHLPIPLIGALTKGDIGGVILFARNFESRDQIMALTQQIHRIPSPYPIWIGVDQEGGKVQRIGESLGSAKIPSAREIGATTPQHAYEVAVETGKDLKHLGFDIDFAPVLDIDTNPANPIIGDRAYGTTPEDVVRYAIPVMNGLRDAGIIACGKHFPGHGDTDKDSHTDLPETMHGIERLRDVEFKPFKAAIDADIPMIMTAHIVMKGLGERLPATLSHDVIGLLRGELHYDGIVVSDDLEMDAIIDRCCTIDAVLRGLRAGVDAFLICKSQYLWINLCKLIRAEAEKDDALKARIFESAHRVLRTKEAYLKA